MRRWLVIAMSLLALTGVCAQASATNLLSNASAEQGNATGDGPAGWETNSWGDIKASFLWASGGFDGDKLLRVVVSKGKEGDAKWWTVPTALEGTTELHVRDRYRCDVESSLLVRFIGADDKKAFATIAKLPPSKDWKTASGAVKVPSWATHFRALHTIGGPGTLDTDAWRAGPPGPEDMPQLPTGASVTVSLSFDGGWKSAVQQLAPKLADTTMKATWFVVPGWMDQPAYSTERVGKDEVIALLQQGHEVGVHSLRHEDVTTLAEARLQTNLAAAKQAIAALGAEVAGFSAPLGEQDKHSRAVIEQHFSYARTREEGANKPETSPWELRSEVIDADVDLETFAQHVVDAAKKQRWLILTWTGPHDGVEGVSAEGFAQQLAYLQHVGADVRPIGAVLGKWKPTTPVTNGPDAGAARTFTPPTPSSKNADYAAPTREVDGCSAEARAHRADNGWVLLVLALLPLAVMGRRRTSRRSAGGR